MNRRKNGTREHKDVTSGRDIAIGLVLIIVVVFLNVWAMP